MKKILLLSDTHSFIDDQILKFVKQADEVWHAGDIGNLNVTDTINKIKPLRAVYGNIDGNDARAQFPLDNKFRIEEMTVWMTHIGGYPNKYHQRVFICLKKFMNIIIKSLIFYYCSTSWAYAYLDPGTGSIIISTLIAFVVTAWNYIKLCYNKSKEFLKNKFKKNN